MKLLVVGSGGREHAIAWKLAQSNRVTKVFVAPGNGGTEQLATNVPIGADELDNLVRFAQGERIDFTVVGPDQPLASGIVDLFENAGLLIFGPKRQAARLESSKSFAKEFMIRHGIPTARYQLFSDSSSAVRALSVFGLPVVIKADGLALGKGVVIARTRQEAQSAIHAMMDEGQFGAAGKTIVLEEFLQGTECSLHALIDGKRALLLATAQDHKQLLDGDRGPNTGGMGAFSPSRRCDAGTLTQIHEQILSPCLAGFQKDGIDFRGLLFPGLMLTPAGPKVLEFNCRFGDPETQAILPRLQCDFASLLEAAATGNLSQLETRWAPEVTVCVVMAAAGYPGRPEVGDEITGLAEAEAAGKVSIFHAGTRRTGSELVTAGGRVLGVTALGRNLQEAREHAYAAAGKINFRGAYFRRDIGAAI